jgi:hypothetical protein
MSKKLLKKEDLNYAARIADGESGGDFSNSKLKRKYKFKNSVSQNTGGVVRPYYEDSSVPVCDMLSLFLESVEKLKKKKRKKVIKEVASTDFGDTTTCNTDSAQLAEYGDGPDFSGKNNPT